MEITARTQPGPLGENKTFGFDCRMCGSCCRDDRVIALNPQDVFLASRHLGLSTGDFMRQRAAVDYAAGLNGFPLVTLRTENGACIFVEQNSLCAIHAARPACCRNYPVGTGFGPDGALQHELMDPAPGCAGFDDGPAHTVNSWWSKSGMTTLLPGIRLLASAARAVTRRLSSEQQQQLFTVLYDFDSVKLDVCSHSAAFEDIAPHIEKRIDKLLENTQPLQKP